MFSPERERRGRREREREREGEREGEKEREGGRKGGRAGKGRRVREGGYREDREHHVIVVDEEEQLLLAERELSCHSEDEVLHFTLQRGQTLIHLEWNTDTPQHLE